MTELTPVVLKVKEPKLTRIIEEHHFLNAKYVAILYVIDKKPMVRSKGNKYYERVVGYRERVRILDWQATPDEQLTKSWLQRRREQLERELGVAVEGLLLTVEEA